ncbi:MAG: YihA family ribosome biogenesis GTP-binding protein [Oscillospiraceae bacterium]|nr:YihA family ribosome biogenesis GTP-binding protein [Oscillospiraceae bacterium]
MNFNKAEFERAYGLAEQLPPSEKIEIVFAGRSNVGKSSLINKLFNRKNLARVSSVPGKTATVNFYSCENVHLVDLPGYGFAKAAKGEKIRFSQLVGGYLGDTERNIGLVIQLVDMRHAPSKEDVQMINYLIDEELPFVIAFTKADKLNKTEREKRLSAYPSEIPCFEDITWVTTSSENGEGVDTLREFIESVAEEDEPVEE